MLSDIDGNPKNQPPHQADYNRWMRGLKRSDYDAIMGALNEVMDEAIRSGDARGDAGIFNASYVPGSDWTDTPYQPIFEACNESQEQARLFYGLLVWVAVIAREEEWYFIRQEIEGDRVLGLTYFLRG